MADKFSTPEKWSSKPLAKIVDPDGLFLPKEDMLAGNESEEQTAVRNYPFPHADKSDKANINPRKVKGSPVNRDHSKDGERPLTHIETDYMGKAPKEEMLESWADYSEAGNNAACENNVRDYLKQNNSLYKITVDYDYKHFVRFYLGAPLSENDLVEVKKLWPGAKFSQRRWGEKFPTYILQANYPHATLTETATTYFQEMGNPEAPPGIENEYNSEYDGVATFEELDEPEPSLDIDYENVPDFLKENKRTPQKMQEARDDVAQFFKANPKVKPRDKGAYAKYKAWAQANGIEPTYPQTFNRNAGKFASTAPVSLEPEKPKVFSAGAKEILKDLDSVTSSVVEETFRNLADIAAKIASRESMAPHHGFVYGTGGTGKSFTVVKTVEEICESNPEYERWKVLKGSTTPAALYQLLWKYRDGWVIIFDDNDGVLKDVNALNYLKAAMDPDQPRIVSKSSMKTLEAADNSMGKYLRESFLIREGRYEDEDENGEDVYGDEEAGDDEEMLITRTGTELADVEMSRKRRQKELQSERNNYWIDHVDSDIDPASGSGEESEDGMPAAVKKTPPEFQFASRIIFISNLNSLPQPLADRCEPGEVKLTKAQILDRIEQILDSLIDKEPKLLAMKDKGRAVKLEVLSYLRKIVAAEDEGLADANGEPFVINAPFTFRLFAKCVSYRVLYPDIWKRRVIKALREKSAKV